MNNFHTNRGFTLIELLVVISIIGTLSTIVLASLKGARDKANEAKKLIEVKSVNTALKMFAMNNGIAPANNNIVDGVPMPAQEGTGPYNTSMDELVTAGVLSTIPKSPDNSYYYFDYGGPDGQGATFFVGWNGVCGSSVTGADGLTYGTVTGADGKCWLDRNLGATQVAVSSTDTASYGHYYQWGRLSDGHQIPTSGTVSTQSQGDIPGHSNFIINYPNWRNPANDNLWQGVNGINNPCPFGFRLPTQPEWATLVSAAGITNIATAYSSSLKLSLAGRRRFNVSGQLDSQGSVGYYWSSSLKSVAFPDTFPYEFAFNSGGVYPNFYNSHADGFSVRCLGN